MSATLFITTIVIGLSFFSCGAAAAQENFGVSVTSHAEPQSAINSAVTPPLRVIITETPEQAIASERKEAEARDNDAKDLAAQLRAASAAERQVYPSWIGAIISAASTLLLVWTLFETRKSTKAARDAADRAMEAIQSDRAWLTFHALSTGIVENAFIDGIPAKNVFFVDVQFENSGRSPAINVMFSSQHRLLPKGSEVPTFDIGEAQVPTFGTIGSGRFASAPAISLNEQDTNLFLAGSRTLIVFCRATYSEIFKPEVVRHTDTCLAIERNGSVIKDGKTIPNFLTSIVGRQNGVQ